MATEIIRNVPTNELQQGDIVLTDGMRVELSRPAHVFAIQGGKCWAWYGTVLNPKEAVNECGIPRSFLTKVLPDGNGGWSAKQHFPIWNVQGNELAHWTVEREAK